MRSHPLNPNYASIQNLPFALEPRGKAAPIRARKSGCLYRSCRTVTEMNQGYTTFGGWSDTRLQSELILAPVGHRTTLTFCNLCGITRMRTIKGVDDSIVLG